MIARGKRLGTRAIVLSLLSGVIAGVTGAAGQDATVSSRITAAPSAFVASSTTLPVSLKRPIDTGRLPGDGIARPVVIVPGPGSGRVPQLPVVTLPVTGGSPGDGGTGSTPTTVTPPPAGQSGPTGDPGEHVPPSDPGQNGPTGPTGDPGQNGPVGDPPGKGHPTGDPNGHHHGGDGQGPGNSGQTNPPVPVPVSNPTPPVTTPTPSPPTVSHTPVTPPPTTTTPAPTPPPSTGSKPPVTKPKTKTGGHGFSVTGLAPVKTSHHRPTNPLLSAANSGITVPLRRVAADLARVADGAGLGATATGAGAGSSSTSARQTAAAAAAAHLAAVRAAEAKRRAAAARANGSLPHFISITAKQIVRFIPSSIWIALAASLGLALMGATAAVAAGRRARRQAHRVAEVSAVALTDPLTGVLNRRGFIEAAERELDRAVRHGRPFAISYIDVRGLKRVNDGEGHLAGDQVLKAAGTALTDSVRAHDVVGRLGGDEFGLLLAEQTVQEAAQVAERIADQVAITRSELGFAAEWDLTVGTASFPQDGSTIDELLDAADRRLYEKRGIALTAAR